MSNIKTLLILDIPLPMDLNVAYFNYYTLIKSKSLLIVGIFV